MTLLRTLRELTLRLRVKQTAVAVQLCERDIEKAKLDLERALAAEREARNEWTLFLATHGQP